MAIRFGVSSTVKNRLPRYSNFWDGTAVYNPFSPTGSYDALATYTVPSGGVSSITFAGLPTGGQYAHLQIRVMYPTGYWGRIRFNGDTTTSNYRGHNIQGSGGAVGAGTSANELYFPQGYNGNTDKPYVAILDILDYASNSKYKTTRSLEGYDANTEGYITFCSGLWMSTSAINSFTITSGSTNFGQFSSFALYGVK